MSIRISYIRDNFFNAAAEREIYSKVGFDD